LDAQLTTSISVGIMWNAHKKMIKTRTKYLLEQNMRLIAYVFLDSDGPLLPLGRSQVTCAGEDIYLTLLTLNVLPWLLQPGSSIFLVITRKSAGRCAPTDRWTALDGPY
jgi:hypothetical protein